MQRSFLPTNKKSLIKPPLEKAAALCYNSFKQIKRGFLHMLEKYIDAATRRKKADLVLKNATFVDVFTGVLRKGDIAIADEKIVGTGEYEGETEIDCTNLTVVPGYIDGHVHIESSQL